MASKDLAHRTPSIALRNTSCEQTPTSKAWRRNWTVPIGSFRGGGNPSRFSHTEFVIFGSGIILSCWQHRESQFWRNAESSPRSACIFASSGEITVCQSGVWYVLFRGVSRPRRILMLGWSHRHCSCRPAFTMSTQFVPQLHLHKCFLA